MRSGPEVLGPSSSRLDRGHRERRSQGVGSSAVDRSGLAGGWLACRTAQSRPMEPAMRCDVVDESSPEYVYLLGLYLGDGCISQHPRRVHKLRTSWTRSTRRSSAGRLPVSDSGRGGWSHPRYSFTNHSADIHSIFRGTCERIGARWTAASRTRPTCPVKPTSRG